MIEIKDLNKTFANHKVLENLNCNIKTNSIYGLIGANGAGKSTLLRIINDIFRKDSGTVLIDGQEIMNNEELKQKLVFIPDDLYFMPNYTLKDMAIFYEAMYKNFDMNYLQELAKILKLDLKTKIQSFSKGMKQKVIIISALMHNPDILFLDEPLSGLDANSVLVIKEIISKLRDEGKTIFYSSHIMEVVEKISDRILLLKDGRIIADGNFEDIKKLNNKESLEEVFNDLTGFEDHSMIADKFVKVIKEV